MEHIEPFNTFLVSILPLAIYFLYNFLRNGKRREYAKSDVVIITGCDSGIGLQLAEYFTKQYNFHVLACLLALNDSPGHKRLKNLSKEKANLHLLKLDVKSHDDIDQLIKYINSKKESKEFYNIIALINNAGVLVYGEFDWLTWPQIENQINVNLLGTIAMTRSLLHELISSKGRIINMSSICESIVMPGVSVYAASKAALGTFTQMLGYEMEKFGVKTIRIKLGDFAKLTNIMSRHESNKVEMWDDMGDRKRKLYDGYFEEFHDLVTSKMGFTGVSSYDESTLFKDVEDAIFLENPSSTLTIAPLRFRIIYKILETIPVEWTYALLRNSIPISLKRTKS